MNNFLDHNSLAAAALGLPGLQAPAWPMAPLLAWTGWAVASGVLWAGLALFGAWVAWLLRRCQHQRQAAIRHLEALCRLDGHELLSDGAAARLAPLPESSLWHAVAEQVREALRRPCQRLEELDHSRSALEVRSRRAAVESAQVKAIFAGLCDPILAVDDYGEVVLANRSAQELLGFELATATNRALAELLHCEKLLNLISGVSRRKTPGSRMDEIEIADQDGQPHWYRVTAMKLAADDAGTDQQGPASAGVVAVLHDIGDQKALQKRNAEFVSSVSHEMKTPLAGIKAYVELLADGDAEDEQTREEFLNVINGQADRLQRLVDNLLNLARIEAGVVQVNKQHRPLNELLDEALHVVQPSAESKGIELVSELSPMYLGVLADRDMMLQAAINLLSNAIKYTHAGGRVALRSRLADNEVRFEVADTGVGLSSEDCQRVFEKFYRVNKDKNMASGTGLGLPLAKHIVEDVHGGHLTLESTLGEGSTFMVALPSAGQLT